MSLRTRGALAGSIVLGLVVLTFLVWATSRSEASTATNPSAATSAGPSDNFGFSKAVQAKVNRLNAELDRCLRANGAERVTLEGGGWTYTDPEGRPSAACSSAQDRVNAYANGEEYQTAVAAILPAVEAYAACLTRQGASEGHGSLSADEQAVLVRAHVACGGAAKDAGAAG